MNSALPLKVFPKPQALPIHLKSIRACTLQELLAGRPRPLRSDWIFIQFGARIRLKILGQTRRIDGKKKYADNDYKQGNSEHYCNTVPSCCWMLA